MADGLLAKKTFLKRLPRTLSRLRLDGVDTVSCMTLAADPVSVMASRTASSDSLASPPQPFSLSSTFSVNTGVGGSPVGSFLRTLRLFLSTGACIVSPSFALSDTTSRTTATNASSTFSPVQALVSKNGTFSSSARASISPSIRDTCLLAAAAVDSLPHELTRVHSPSSPSSSPPSPSQCGSANVDDDTRRPGTAASIASQLSMAAVLVVDIVVDEIRGSMPSGTRFSDPLCAVAAAEKTDTLCADTGAGGADTTERDRRTPSPLPSMAATGTLLTDLGLIGNEGILWLSSPSSW